MVQGVLQALGFLAILYEYIRCFSRASLHQYTTLAIFMSLGTQKSLSNNAAVYGLASRQLCIG
jgi:hypothetical protein